MDLYKAIEDLCVEKENLDRVIAALEKLQHAAGLGITAAPASGKRRGRKAMSPEYRREAPGR
jgi:hypothetical protein